MKKTITILASLALVFSLSSFVTGEPGKPSTANRPATSGVPAAIAVSANEDVNEFLKTDFANATSVTWTKKSDLYFADFTLDGRLMGAAFNEDGKLLASSRLITPEEVPGNLVKRAEGNFRKGHSAPRVLEIDQNGEKTYYFNIITDRYIIECHADADGVITEEGRMKLQK